MTATTFRRAFPELRRTAPDVLRMAGVPLALADEGADLLIWTEAAVGGALAFLRERRHERSGSPAVRSLTDAGDHVVVDLGGVSLLEMGLRAFDFACARAASGAAGMAVLRDTAGPQFLPYLARRCAQRGYAVRATWDGEAVPVRDGWSPSAVEAVPADGRVQVAVWPAPGPGGHGLK